MLRVVAFENSLPTIGLLQDWHYGVVVPIVQVQPCVQCLLVVLSIHQPVVAHAEVILKEEQINGTEMHSIWATLALTINYKT